MSNFLSLPPEASAQAARIDSALLSVHWLMVVFFGGWLLFFLYALVRFRRTKNPGARYEGLRSKLPFAVVGAFALCEGGLLVGVDLPLWMHLVNDMPTAAGATEVRVVAEQYVWNVQYPGPDGIFGKTDPSLMSADNPLGLDTSDPASRDDITTINQLNLPVGVPVIVHLTSKDVIHSFSIPYFRVKQDAIPGQNVRISFTPTLTSDSVRQLLAHDIRIDRSVNADDLVQFVSLQDCRGARGDTILSKGDALSQDALDALLRAGITSLRVGPYSPIEVVCSQLCGLGHYRMKAMVTVQTRREFDRWLAGEEAGLQQH